MKDLAIWLGKYAGVIYTHAARLEGYTMHALAKMAHSNPYHTGKHLHETVLYPNLDLHPDPYLRPDYSLCPVTRPIPASCSIAAKRPSPL